MSAVTQAPLFTCELTNEGQVALTPVERFDMRVHLGRFERRRVYVRTEVGLKLMAVPPPARQARGARRRLDGATGPDADERRPLAAVEVVTRHRLEGLFAKRRNSRYRRGRSPDWIKVKAIRTVSCLAK